MVFLRSRRPTYGAVGRRASRCMRLDAPSASISRGIASGSSIREIARGLQRAASTVSREVPPPMPPN
jgi:DNA-binding NarL/FixJ family response regulator